MRIQQNLDIEVGHSSNDNTAKNGITTENSNGSAIQTKFN